MAARPPALPLVLAALGGLALSACTPPVGVADVELVTGYRVSPTFNAFTEPCTITYRLERPAWVQIRVVQVQPGGERALVRQITEEQRETPGSRTAAWRGIGPNGLFAPQGTYTVELYARLDGADQAEEWTLTTVMFRS